MLRSHITCIFWICHNIYRISTWLLHIFAVWFLYMNDGRDHLPAPLLCPFRFPTSICNIATHIFWTFATSTYFEHAPPLYVTLQHIFWTCHNIMSEQNCRTTLEARCTIQGIQELWIVIFVSTNCVRYCCSVVSLWLIAMRMIWSPITPPMSVAPRGSRVWQPPTVPIMYCFFNYPSYYINYCAEYVLLL